MPSLPSTVVEDSIPFGRIVRYAVYAVGIFAVGTFVAAVVGELFGLVVVLLFSVSEGLARSVADGVDLLERAIRVFALLVGVGVFLSQFEKP